MVLPGLHLIQLVIQVQQLAVRQYTLSLTQLLQPLTVEALLLRVEVLARQSIFQLVVPEQALHAQEHLHQVLHQVYQLPATRQYHLHYIVLVIVLPVASLSSGNHHRPEQPARGLILPAHRLPTIHSPASPPIPIISVS